jgi:RES domain
MDRNLAVAVAGCGTTAINGVFQRHVSPNVRTLTGSTAGGRWGAPGAFSVLYLGRPLTSVIVEAYRHLVDDIEGMRPEFVRPRRLLTVEVGLTNILDLREPEHQEAVGLTFDDLRTRPGDYVRCQRVGQAAHQLGLHGLVAPAATGLGETLAVFELHLPVNEQPILLDEEEWTHLPDDPRVLRAVEGDAPAS